MALRDDADRIITEAIRDALPDEAVRRALRGAELGAGKLVLIAAGKAAWRMAKAASDLLGSRIADGVVVTKDGHSEGPVGDLKIREAGHPVPDGRSFAAAREAAEAVSGLHEEDTVLFLLSGGGSALFELPRIPERDLARVTRELLERGAGIKEINVIRKRFSAVKGGRFAKLYAPAKVFAVLLSDVPGGRPDVIASGPVSPDPSTAEDARAVAERYRLTMTDEMRALLDEETPKALDNVTVTVTGSALQLCRSAERTSRALGYEPVFLTDSLRCEARQAGIFLADVARAHAGKGKKLAFLAGGETLVRVTGTGKGGRNQELALAAAEGIAGLDACVFSVGSDGTDGPTDAAGGFVDGTTYAKLLEKGVSPRAALGNNDSYHALRSVGSLIVTGPTGTNVNDLCAVLIGG